MSALIDIKEQCRGKWSGVLISLGWGEVIFNGKHQPCPKCGGKDRFRWHRAKEVGFCNQCGSMQPMEMAIEITGKDFKETANKIRGYRLEDIQPAQHQDDTVKNQARIDAIKPGLKKLNGSDPASLYLINRGLSARPKQHVWYHNNINGYPAMVSMFSTAQGELSTLHITAITKDGQKAPVEVQKRIMKVVRPMTGGAIRLFMPEQGVLGVAEGIESALAAHQLDGLPVWATGNAEMMAKLELPSDITELWIYADNDANFTGQRAAYALANRYSSKGLKKIRVCRIQEGFDWLTDSGVSADFLDYLLLEKAAS